MKKILLLVLAFFSLNGVKGTGLVHRRIPISSQETKLKSIQQKFQLSDQEIATLRKNLHPLFTEANDTYLERVNNMSPQVYNHVLGGTTNLTRREKCLIYGGIPALLALTWLLAEIAQRSGVTIQLL